MCDRSRIFDGCLLALSIGEDREILLRFGTKRSGAANRIGNNARLLHAKAAGENKRARAHFRTGTTNIEAVNFDPT